MEWRCEWCGKPHDEDDPPCDACGHGSFERAIVRAPEALDAVPTYVWTCVSCGREHIRNSPPCSRCGEPTLERREQDLSAIEDDLDVPSYLEVARPYLPIVAVFVVLVVLVVTGIIPLAEILDRSPSMPEDVPGDGDEWNAIDLAATEGAILDRLDEERTAADRPPLDRDGQLATYATYYNRMFVKALFEEETTPVETDPSEFGVRCSSTPVVFPWYVAPGPTGAAGTTSEALAEHVVSEILSEQGVADRLPTRSTAAVDLHGVDDVVVFTYVQC